jgi:hypothetical protein
LKRTRRLGKENPGRSSRIQKANKRQNSKKPPPLFFFLAFP